MNKIRAVLVGMLVLFPSLVYAETPSSDAKGQSISIDALKKDYWDLGDPTSVYRVVQRRSFEKAGRVELGISGTLIASDPFVTDNAVGVTLGYYLSENVQLSIMGWKDYSSDSEALRRLQAVGTTTNSNPPYSFIGGGLEFSPVYGKISLLGSQIIHYDLHLSAGTGLRSTETGQFLAGLIGIGQIFFLSSRLGLRLDYRMCIYSELIKEKVDPTRLGQSNGNRTNRGDLISIGLSLFI